MYGSGPEPAIIERGGSAEGLMFLGPDPHDTILGYVHGDVVLSNLDDWNVQEITAEEALTLAQSLVPEATMGEDGRILFPVQDLFI
jgi:hypothetical protein